MLFEPRHHPFLSVQVSCRTACKQTVPGSLKLQIWTHWTSASRLSCVGCHAGKHRKLQPKPKTTDKLKAACRPSRKSCHKNTRTRRWRTSLSAPLPTWLWLPMMVTPGICSNSVHLQVSSRHQQTGSFQSYHQTTGEDYTWNTEKWEVVSVKTA